MIHFQKTRIDRSVSRQVANATLITAEGAPLIASSAVEGGVTVSAGSASEVFVGISYSQQKSLLGVSTVEEIVVDAQGRFSLANPRLGTTWRPTILAANGSGAETLLDDTPAVPGSPAAGEVEAFSGSSQIFQTNVSNAGRTVRVYYRYAPTAVQAQMLQGDVHPGGDSGYILNAVGVILAGDVYTDQFDPTVDWVAGGVLKVTAANLFTIGGSGPTATGARIIATPTAASPYLGISLNNG